MSRLFSLFLLTLLSLLFFASALHLQCDPGQTDVYIYDSLVSAFGGTDEAQAENKEEFTITATIGITCLKRFQTKGTKTEYAHLNVFNIKHAQVRMQTAAQWNDESPQTAQAPKNATGGYEPMIHEIEGKLVEGDTYYIQSENGKIFKVVYPKEEDPIITNLKKAIIQELQTKVKGDSRIEHTTVGIVKGHYTRAQGEDGTVFLQKKADTSDILQDAFGDEENGHVSGKRYAQETIVALTPNGRVVEAVTEKTVDFGKASERKHAAFKNLKEKIKYERGQEAPRIDGYFAGKTKSVLSFVEQVDINPILKEQNLVDIDHESLFAEGIVEVFEDDDYSDDDFAAVKTRLHETMKESTLLADEDLFNTLQGLYRKKLESQINLRDVLKNLHAFHKDLVKKQKETGDEDVGAEYTSENVNLVASAQHFCKYLPDTCLEIALSYFSEIDANEEENHSISHILQSIMASTQSEQGQEALVKSMTNSHLTRHAILRTLDVKKPKSVIVNKLKELSEGKNLPTDADDDEREFIKDNAYMAWADIASRIDPESGIEIVQKIMDNMKDSEDEDELVLHVHALGNAGEAVPIEAIRQLITSKSIGDPAKEAAIQALRKFVSPSSVGQATKILHNVLRDPRSHTILKKRAISSLFSHLEKRRPKSFKKNGDEDEAPNTTEVTVKFLERFLHDNEVDPTLKKAILEFYIEEGSDLSGGVLENFFTGSESPIFDDDDLYSEQLSSLFEDDDQLLRGVGRVIRRVGRAVRDAVRGVGRVVNGVINGAKAIAELPGKISNVVSSFKGVFKTATFKGQQICVIVNADKSRMCVYDSDMASFIQRQGGLSRMKFSKQFTFEKLLGTEALHAYVGGIGYAGASVYCKQGHVEVSVFGRVSAYTKILNKRTELLTGELELNKLVNQNVKDRVYLKVFGSVIVNKSLLPDNVKKFINQCASTRKNLIYKDYPNLVSIEVIIPIVIPFSIRLGVAAKFGIDLVYHVCPAQLKISAGIEPFFGVGVTGGAGISIWVASGHVTISATFDYRLQPSIGLENCQLCARLDHETHPLVISIGGSLRFLTWSWNKKFLEFKTNPIKGNLFKYCLNIFKINFDDDERAISPNLRYLNTFFEDSDLDEYIYSYKSLAF